MTKKEMVMAAIEANGYRPQIDNDGDVFVRFQMKTIYFMLSPDEEDQYVVVLLPQFADVDEGEEALTLAVCNKEIRELRLAKVYIDQTLKNVSASCEFFYTDSECLKVCVEHALNILGLVRATFFRLKGEISEC